MATKKTLTVDSDGSLAKADTNGDGHLSEQELDMHLEFKRKVPKTLRGRNGNNKEVMCKIQKNNLPGTITNLLVFYWLVYRCL